MALKLPTLVFGSALTAITAVGAIWTVTAAPGLGPVPLRFEEPWQLRAPPLMESQSEHAYDEKTAIQPAVARLHRAADGFVLFAKSVSAEEERQLLAHGFRKVGSLAEARDRSIFEHEAYFGYMVGAGGPADDDLKRLEGAVVKARFKTYRGAGAPMLTEVNRL